MVAELASTQRSEIARRTRLMSLPADIGQITGMNDEGVVSEVIFISRRVAFFPVPLAPMGSSLKTEPEFTRENNPQSTAARIYETYFNELVGFLEKRDCLDPENIAAETMINAYKAILSGKYTAEGAERGWIYKIAINANISQGRRQQLLQKKLGTQIPLDDQEGAASAFGVSSFEKISTLRVQLEQALGKLPKHYADVVILTHAHGRRLKEAAAILGITEDAAKLRLFRATKMLREMDELRDVVKSEAASIEPHATENHVVVDFAHGELSVSVGVNPVA